MEQPILGIDVAKQKLDAALLLHQQTLIRQFDNSSSGFKLLQTWLESLQVTHVHACLEAIGSYGDAIAPFLHESAHLVSVVNPFRLKGYANSKLSRNKTDTADARLIADFCLPQKPGQWFPPTPEVAELQALKRRIEALEQMLQMEKNRLASSPDKIKPSLSWQLSKRRLPASKKNIKHHFDQHPGLQEQTQLLQTIPEVGEKTAQLLLSEIEFSRYKSAREVAAFAGVTPNKENFRNQFESNPSVKNGQRQAS